MVPAEGFEPPTNGLQNRTVALIWLALFSNHARNGPISIKRLPGFFKPEQWSGCGLTSAPVDARDPASASARGLAVVHFKRDFSRCRPGGSNAGATRATFPASWDRHHATRNAIPALAAVATRSTLGREIGPRMPLAASVLLYPSYWFSRCQFRAAADPEVTLQDWPRFRSPSSMC